MFSKNIFYKNAVLIRLLNSFYRAAFQRLLSAILQLFRYAFADSLSLPFVVPIVYFRAEINTGSTTDADLGVDINIHSIFLLIIIVVIAQRMWYVERSRYYYGFILKIYCAVFEKTCPDIILKAADNRIEAFCEEVNMPCPKFDAAAASAILTTTVNVRPKTWSFAARKKIKRAGSPAALSKRSVKFQM